MIHQVTADIYRGPRPEDPYHFDVLKRNGIKSVLDLETYALDWRGNEREGYLWQLAIRDIVPMSLPLGAVLPPSLNRLGMAVGLLETDYAALPGPTYVHCRFGKDRTGMLIAAYRIREENVAVEDAIDEMLAMGFHRRYLWWLPQLTRFARA